MLTNSFNNALGIINITSGTFFKGEQLHTIIKFTDYGKILTKCKLAIHHADHRTAENNAFVWNSSIYSTLTGTKGRYNVASQLVQMGVGQLLHVASISSNTDILKAVEYLLSKPVQSDVI